MTYQAFEENDISIKANGGTELSKRGVAYYLSPGLTEDFQIICSRPRTLLEDKIRVFWHHDLPNDQEVAHMRDPASRNRFHHHVFVSHWQLQQYWERLGFPMDGSVSVIENPILTYSVDMDRFNQPMETIDLVYASTPHRGLSLLVPVFEELAQDEPAIRLHVFSSFKMYGWDDADKNFQDLFDKIDAHPQMINHGFQPNGTVRARMNKSHILAYPNIWPETSCRVLIEAMSEGLECVHPNLAALPETSGGLTDMYTFHADPSVHAHVFKPHLQGAIERIRGERNTHKRLVARLSANERFGFDTILPKWTSLLERLKVQYADVRSRALPQQMFTYSTG